MNPDLTERLSEDLAAIARDAEELFTGKSDTDGDLADRAREIRDRLAAALDRTDQTISQLAEKPASRLDSVEEFVRQRPLQALGVALGVGVLLGFLLKRK